MAVATITPMDVRIATLGMTVSFAPGPTRDCNHDVNRVALLDRDRAIRLAELLNRNNTFQFVSEIDDHLLRRDFDHTPLEQLPFGGRS